MSNPSAWTDDAKRLGYITPESIGDAIVACKGNRAKLTALAAEVLWALNDRACEDWRLCAFVMGRALSPERPAP